MRRPTVLFVAVLAISTLTGCLDLGQVAELSVVSADAKAALPVVSNDFYASCQRRAAIIHRIPQNELPPNMAGITPDCKPYQVVADHLTAAQSVLTDYLDALGKLAKNDPLSYQKNIDTNITTIQGFKTAANVDVDVASDAQKASVAAQTLAKAIANIATRHYREKKVRQAILDADGAVQELTKALQVVVVTDYNIMLDSEKGFNDAYYQGPMAASQGDQRLSLILVQHQYDQELQAIQAHRDAAQSYGRVMQKTAALHAKLAAAAKAPTSFMDSVKQLAPDFIDMKDAVTTLRAETK